MKHNVGQAVIRELESIGVSHVFGIPGIHTIEFYRGLAESTIRHVTPRHEQAAGFMADGYARMTGRPGVCLAITGPGLTNMITPIAQARADSIPMVVISSVNSLGHPAGRSGRLHELPDQSGTMRSLVKKSWTIDTTDNPALPLKEAFALASSGRPGPVHLEIPIDVLNKPAGHSRYTSHSRSTCSVDQKQISSAARTIESVELPVILAGGGAINASHAVSALSELLGAPIITTCNARGIGAGSPLRIPASPSLPPVRELIDSADLVIAIGTEFGETDYDIYREHGQLNIRTLVRIDSSQSQLGCNPKADIAIHMPAEIACELLLDNLAHLELPCSPGAQLAAETRKHALGGLDAEMRYHIEIIDTIQDLASQCTLVGDSTQIPYSGNLYCDIRDGNRWFNSATGFGALGYAVPAAIGVALANPDSTTICIVGDGGLQFTMPELGTAAQLGVRVIFLVWNDRGYGEIRKFMVSKGMTPIGVDPQPPDLSLVAKAYGLPYCKVGDLSGFRRAFARMQEKETSAIIDWQV